MKKIAIIIVILSAVILAAYRFYYADPNIVDGDYISSETYKALQKDIEYEKQSTADRKAVLQVVVRQMLAETNKFQKGLPYRLDSLALDSALKPENRLSIPDMRIMPSDFNNYNFYGLNIFEGENYMAVLSVIELPGVYRDLEVGLTTVRNGEIVDTALIGRYKKNLTEKSSAEISIESGNDIRVRLNKSRSYPFKQNQNVTYRYRITKDGMIESNIL